MLRNSTLLAALAALTFLAGCGGASNDGPTTPDVSGASLIIGGSSANFGVQSMTTGFMPDPATFRVVSGGDINAETADTGNPDCGGWVTAQPDLIIQFEQMTGFLRFGFRADDESEDATLVINDGNGNWHCNDDGEGTGLNPMVDLADAPSGQYDIWVGSFQSGTNVRGQLLVTELESVTPAPQSSEAEE